MQPGVQSYLAFPDLSNLFFLNQHFHISSSIISDRNIPATWKSPFLIIHFSDSFAKIEASHQQCLLTNRLYSAEGKLTLAKQNNICDDLLCSFSHLINDRFIQNNRWFYRYSAKLSTLEHSWFKKKIENSYWLMMVFLIIMPRKMFN